MNNIQILILAGVIFVILVTLIYYWYQDAKFKKRVEDNFNQKTYDVLNDSQDIILDGQDMSSIKKEKPVITKDIHDTAPKINAGRAVDLAGNELPLEQVESKLFNDGILEQVETVVKQDLLDIPEDSMEAFFVKLDQIPFDYKLAGVSKELDLLIDVVLESPKKMKLLPSVEQYTQKSCRYYIMEKNKEWYEYESGKKYNVEAFRLRVPLIDKEGIINKIQVENIYAELYRFVMQNNAHIRSSDYETQLNNIQTQLKTLKDIELVLELYLITKEELSFNKLNKLLIDCQLVNRGNKYYFEQDGDVLFVVADEKGNPLNSTKSFNKLSIVSYLHLHQNPMQLLDSLFDFSESFMMKIEARMLSTNHQVMGQREYEQLVAYVKNYVNSTVKKNIRLGSDLIKRIFTK